MLGGMGVPAPELLAWMAAVAEFGGGLLIALGLLTPPTALLLVGHFLFVSLVGHAGDAFGDRELPLFFLATAVLLLLSGAGRYSIDAVLSRRRP
jgi:putative oxidoreductase